jgi:CBS-domain-containing membrane protein
MTRQAWLGALISLAVFTVIGALALVVNEPLLLPSLGPTALVQLETPHQPSARPWNTLVGHAIGILAAMFALGLTGANQTPEPILTGILSWQRELASALAVTMTFVGQSIFRASHAPAAATALLLTLGAIDPEWRAITILGAGIILITVLGEWGRWAIERFATPRLLHGWRTKVM